MQATPNASRLSPVLVPWEGCDVRWDGIPNKAKDPGHAILGFYKGGLDLYSACNMTL